MDDVLRAILVVPVRVFAADLESDLELVDRMYRFPLIRLGGGAPARAVVDPIHEIVQVLKGTGRELEFASERIVMNDGILSFLIQTLNVDICFGRIALSLGVREPRIDIVVATARVVYIRTATAKWARPSGSPRPTRLDSVSFHVHETGVMQIHQLGHL
jgi:hypothetical protein